MLKFLYALFFMVLFPLGLLAWGHQASLHFTTPLYLPTTWGLVLLGLGGSLFLWSMAILMLYGQGLPMNAFPPPRFVTQGPYRLFSHPIYVGFCLMVYGTALFYRSRAGFFLVAPTTALSTVALVWGYEGIDLAARFTTLRAVPFVGLVPQAQSTPQLVDKGRAVLHLGLLGLFLIALLLGATRPPLASIQLVFLGVSLLGLGSSLLRQQQFTSVIRSSYQIAVLLVLNTLLWLITEQIAWPALGGLLIGMWCKAKRLRNGLLMAAVLLGIWGGWPLTSLVGNGVLFLLAFYIDAMARYFRCITEQTANSWYAWQMGPVRLINHGLYAGVATCLGTQLTFALSGGRFLQAMVLLISFAFLFAALWGQSVEGSERLKRPLGYFGFVLGAVASVPVLSLWNNDLWYLAASVAVSGLFGQGLGRLRCLVNGCCHGRLTAPHLGIKVKHAQSRVTKISQLNRQPIHATQVYSLGGLCLSGGVLLYLWGQEVSFSLLVGLYFILSGLVRFVEEAYRGEVQTKIIGGMRIYQWLALLSVGIGVVLTCLTSEATPGWQPCLQWQQLVVSMCLGLLAVFLMGVDFPASKRRFSRL